jgi:hypothetical protein
MLDILARARRYESLTPAERALLRLLEGLASVALVGAATAAAQYLASPAGAGLSALSWPTIARVCAAGAAVAVLLAVAKYFKAHGDPSLAGTLATLAQRVADSAGVAGSPPAAPPPPAAPSGPESGGPLAAQ